MSVWVDSRGFSVLIQKDLSDTLYQPIDFHTMPPYNRVRRWTLVFSLTRFAFAMIAAATLVLPYAQAQNTALDPKADPRFAKTVTLYFAPTPLGELLQKLSQQTGVMRTPNALLSCIGRFW